MRTMESPPNRAIIARRGIGLRESCSEVSGNAIFTMVKTLVTSQYSTDFETRFHPYLCQLSCDPSLNSL